MRRSFPSRLQDSAGPVPAMLTLGFANKIVWLCLARWRWERFSFRIVRSFRGAKPRWSRPIQVRDPL